MHPIRAIKKKIEARRKRQELDRKVAEYITEIDTRVRVFELDPNLPEIARIKEVAPEMFAHPLGDASARLRLSWLNPYDSVAYSAGHLTIYERQFGHVLQAWSLVEYHLAHYEIKEIVRIRVDGTGTRVYTYKPNREAVHYLAGILNPHRLADPGNRVQNAAAFVDHFTGLHLLDDWEELHRYHWIEVTKQEDSTWSVEYDPEPAYT
jgi:hypothetical protein